MWQYPESASRVALENRIEYFATIKRLGYKTANLMVLSELLDQIHLPHGYHAGIPSFFGIPADAITTFLRHQGLNLSEEWKTVAAKVNDINAFIKASEELAQRIETIFNDVAIN